MGDVLLQEVPGGVDGIAVTGTDLPRTKVAQPFQGIQIIRHASVGRTDHHRSLGCYHVASKEHALILPVEARVVAGVSGRVKHVDSLRAYA